MYKLCENGSFMRIDEYSVHTNIDGKFGWAKMNPSVFFDSNQKINEHEYILYSDRNIVIPLNRKVISILAEIQSIDFVFDNTLQDTPGTELSVSKVNHPINTFEDIVSAYIQYLSYQMINYLPYTDFSIDNMPTIESVIINGKVSNLFADVTKYLNDEFDKVTFIHCFKNATYKYSYNTDFEKIKKVKVEFIRINSNLPLFYKLYKIDFKSFRKLDKIEISLRWFDNCKKDYLTNYEESDIDDYIYSTPGVQGILTFSIAYQYLMLYYMNELKDARKNHFLIVLITGYFKYDTSLKGVRLIYPVDDERKNKIAMRNLLSDIITYSSMM